jgi:hypothetical protein
VRVSSYSTVDAVERNVVNSGVRGKKDRDLRTEVGCATYDLPYHAQAPSTGDL